MSHSRPGLVYIGGEMNRTELIDKREAARRLGGVSVSFVDQLLAKRLLPRVRLSYKVCRIPAAAVEAFIAEHTEASSNSRIMNRRRY